MDIYLLLLRLIHIVSGVFWAGGVFTLAMFILPSINSTMPEGGKVMQKMINTYRFPVYMTLSGFLSMISGLLLYWSVSFGFEIGWIKSPHGLTLTLGGIAAILALLLGFFVNKPRAERMAAIGNTIMKSGGPPTEAQAAEMKSLREAITGLTRYIAFLILFSVIAMAAAKYVN